MASKFWESVWIPDLVTIYNVSTAHNHNCYVKLQYNFISSATRSKLSAEHWANCMLLLTQNNYSVTFSVAFIT